MNDPAQKTILLVEDEALVAMLIEDLIAELGYQVLGPALRLDRALEMARNEPMDAAILDVNVGGQRSYPVAAVLAERGIPYAFATGYDSPGVEHEPGIPILHKPFNREAVQRIVAHLLEVS